MGICSPHKSWRCTGAYLLKLLVPEEVCENGLVQSVCKFVSEHEEQQSVCLFTSENEEMIRFMECVLSVEGSFEILHKTNCCFFLSSVFGVSHRVS